MAKHKEFRNQYATMSGLLGVGSKFEGEILFEGMLRIDGHLHGKIICKNDKPSTVIISEPAVVNADVVADTVIISGQLVGDVRAIDRVEIHAPGRLEGTVYTCDLVIDDGALFQGECVMIRHLTLQEKKALKFDAFQETYHQKHITEKREKLVEIPDKMAKS